MCNRYVSPAAGDMERYWHVGARSPWRAVEVFPCAPGPFIRAARDSTEPARELVIGQWGLIPWFAKSAKLNFPKGRASCASVFEDRPECYDFALFRERGYAVARSDWAVPADAASMLFFMAGFHSAQHRHADDLSFELFEFGEPFLTDSGKYGYKADKWRDFVVSTRAHNALQINGASFSIRPEDAYGSALQFVGQRKNAYRVEGQVLHTPSGATLLRRIFYMPRQWMLVVDQLSGGTVSSTTQWFHFAPQVQVQVSGPAPGPDTLPMFTALLASGRQVQIQQVLGGCQGTLVAGAESPEQGWWTTAYLKLAPRSTLGFSCAAVPPAQATVFVLDPARRTEALAEADGILRGFGLKP